jgi:hypothetical protein
MALVGINLRHGQRVNKLPTRLTREWLPITPRSRVPRGSGD